MGAPSHNFAYLPEYAYSGRHPQGRPQRHRQHHLRPAHARRREPPHAHRPVRRRLRRAPGEDHRRRARCRSTRRASATRSRLVTDPAGQAVRGRQRPERRLGRRRRSAPGPGARAPTRSTSPASTPNDSLHLITGPGYYGGHAEPDPRATTANTFNTTNPQSPVPAANPIECDAADAARPTARSPRFDTATTGMAEYTASNFDGQMSGDLVVGSYYGSVFRVQLDANGTAVVSTQTSVLQRPAPTRSTSRCRATAARSRARSGSPTSPRAPSTCSSPTTSAASSPPPCTGAYSTSLDEDHDGYTNADEIDNHTDPCSAADLPPRLEPQLRLRPATTRTTTATALPDTSDPFADRPGQRPDHPPSRSRYSWVNGAPANPCAPTPFPSGCPGGLLGLGFTGLMTDGAHRLRQPVRHAAR